MSEPTPVAVAAPSTAAADAGGRVAALGGNCVDAALAASLVTLVNEPGIVSLSSGAFLTVQPPGAAAPVTVDGWVEMPGRSLEAGRLGGGTWDLTTAYGGGTTMTVGPGSVATHGTLAAFGAAHERWGAVPWREIVAPALEVARAGAPLGTASRHYLAYVHDDLYGWDDRSRAALHGPDGALVSEDVPVVVDGLADALETIARHGPRAMYEGDLGAAISAAVLEGGGILTGDDLAAYAPVVRPALSVRAGDWNLGINPPPSVGGLCVAAMLTLLDGRPAGGWSQEDTDFLVGVQRAVLRHRLDVLDVTPDLRAAGESLLARAAGGTVVLESASTTHVSAADARGGACAVTASSGYGSGMIAPGTGIWLNNCLGEPELNTRGLHAYEPGTRLLSNMAPTVGRRDDGAVLAIGSPGADRITTALVQALAGFVGGLGMQDAIDHPRLHVRLARDGAPDVIEHEEGLRLTGTGLPHVSYPLHEMYFGGVAAACWSAAEGLLAAADPRRDGAVSVSPHSHDAA